MSNKPLVSIVMPVYNGVEYLSLAIESILNQTYSNFEFIIINDCSTDNSLAVIEAYAKKDSRIKVLMNEKNVGIADSMNIGLYAAKGKYIAIMNQDDISINNRLHAQVSYLDAHADVSILNTDYHKIGSDGEILSTKILKDGNPFKVSLLFRNLLAHPTIMLNREDILSKNLHYKKSYDGADDYKLWTEASAAGLKIDNLSEILLKYRIHDKQTSFVKAKYLEDLAFQIREEYAYSLFCNFLSDEEIEFVGTHKMFSLNEYLDLIEQIREKNKNNPNISKGDLDCLLNRKVDSMFKKECFKKALKEQKTKVEKLKLYQLYLKRTINKMLGRKSAD